MTASPDQLVTQPRTDRRSDAIFFAVAAVLFTASVAMMVYFCRTMSGGMAMPGGWTMSMMWMRMPGQTWAQAAAMFMLMWLAMMIAMMLPSSLPMIFRYHRRSHGQIWITSLMIAGYFFVWMLVGAIAYLLGIPFALAAMRSEALSRSVPALIGVAVIAGGCLQFIPLTMRGLTHCRGPLSCAFSQTRANLGSAWRCGIDCGICCAQCCLGPTLILIALGMMNPIVMVAVAGIIAVEKLLPRPKEMFRLIGILAIISGIAIVAWPALRP